MKPKPTTKSRRATSAPSTFTEAERAELLDKVKYFQLLTGNLIRQRDEAEQKIKSLVTVSPDIALLCLRLKAYSAASDAQQSAQQRRNEAERVLSNEVAALAKKTEEAAHAAYYAFKAASLDEMILEDQHFRLDVNNCGRVVVKPFKTQAYTEVAK